MRIGNIIQWFQFKLGGLVFPLMEPVYRGMENRDPTVKKHFCQAVHSLEQKRTPIALLNLNMVLSIKPDHFLARVYRGRIYIRDGRYRLASEDFLQANKISRFRFAQYDLSHEYFSSVKKEFGELGASISKNFDQIFEALKTSTPERGGDPDGIDQIIESLPFSEENGKPDSALDDYESIEDSESIRFKNLGPITQNEIEETDWDKLIKELTS